MLPHAKIRSDLITNAPENRLFRRGIATVFRSFQVRPNEGDHMRRILLRAFTAGAATVGLVLPSAVPARADAATVVAAVKAAYSLYQQFAGGSGPTLQQAIDQITATIQNSQTAIISQIDQVATASVRACATSAVINFADINALSPDNLQNFALQTTDCVTQAKSLIDAVSADQAATDELGFAMNTVGPLALMARTKAGLTTPALKAVLAAGENTLITALLPSCDMEDLNGGEPGAPHRFAWVCTAYNGDTGRVLIRNNDATARTTSEDRATMNTSRAIAKAALPPLTS
jgi:hypothetical protein